MRISLKARGPMFGFLAASAVAFALAIFWPQSAARLAKGGASKAGPTAAAVGEKFELPVSVAGNPFSHPKLAKKVDAPQKLPGLTAIDQLPPFDPAVDGALSGVIAPLPEVPEPEQSTGGSRHENGAPPKLVLNAVVRMQKPVALISSGSEGSKPFNEGDFVVPGIRVLEIREDAVVLRTARGDRILKMGGRK